MRVQAEHNDAEGDDCAAERLDLAQEAAWSGRAAEQLQHLAGKDLHVGARALAAPMLL